MQKALIGFVMVALSLAGCNRSPAPPVSSGISGDAVQRKLQELAGNGAADCGRLKPPAQDKLDQLEAASTCAMGAAKKRQAFYVAYELPGMIVALAGNSDGKLFSVQQEQPASAPSGTAAELTAAPCPSGLRIAQSGRVTCFAPGSMGGSSMGGSSMGGASPHGGMSMPPGGSASPHGGMNMSPGGAPSPHGGGASDLPSGHSKSTP
jgi:hypothetical protein